MLKVLYFIFPLNDLDTRLYLLMGQRYKKNIFYIFFGDPLV